MVPQMPVKQTNTKSPFKWKLGRFAKDNEGSSTIEFVLWVPVFALILSLVIDVCFLFLAQSRMFDVASDATRQLAIRRLDDTGAQNYAIQNASFGGATASASADCPNGTGYCEVTIELNSAEVAVTGILNFISTDKLTATVRQLQENS